MIEHTFWANRVVWWLDQQRLLHWKKKSGLMGPLLGTKGSLTQMHLHTDSTCLSEAYFACIVLGYEAAQAALRTDWQSSYSRAFTEHDKSWAAVEKMGKIGAEQVSALKPFVTVVHSDPNLSSGFTEPLITDLELSASINLALVAYTGRQLGISYQRLGEAQIDAILYICYTIGRQKHNRIATKQQKEPSVPSTSASTSRLWTHDGQIYQLMPNPLEPVRTPNVYEVAHDPGKSQVPACRTCG